MSPSATHIAEVSEKGIRLQVGDRELFLPYEDFPWFRDASIAKVLNVEQHTPGHFYWPDLDVDLGIDSIEHPERFPLKAKLTPDHTPDGSA